MEILQIYISGFIVSWLLIAILYYRDYKVYGIPIFPIDIHDVGYLTVLSLTSWVGAIIIGGFVFDEIFGHE